MTRRLPVRILMTVVLAALAITVTTSLSQAANDPTFQPNIVELNQSDNKWSLEFATGTEVPLSKVIQEAVDDKAFGWDELIEVSVFNPKSGKLSTFKKKQLQTSAGLPTFTFSDASTILRFPDDSAAAYCGVQADCASQVAPLTCLEDPGKNCFPFSPTVNVTLEKKADTGLVVKLDADVTTVKQGGTVAFTVRAIGSTDPEYAWDFGDGTTLKVGSKQESHRYTEAGKFTAKVTVTSGGVSKVGTITITVTDKPKKKPPKKDPPKKKQPEKKPAQSGGGSPNPPGGGGGTGTPGQTPSTTVPPATPVTPKPDPEPEKPEPKADDGLVPVSGELLDDSIPGEVFVPAGQDPEAGEPEAEADPKGFAFSGGAKTALGIAVLLGVGGLAEIGSFSRFR